MKNGEGDVEKRGRRKEEGSGSRVWLCVCLLASYRWLREQVERRREAPGAARPSCSPSHLAAAVGMPFHRQQGKKTAAKTPKIHTENIMPPPENNTQPKRPALV